MRSPIAACRDLHRARRALFAANVKPKSVTLNLAGDFPVNLRPGMSRERVEATVDVLCVLWPDWIEPVTDEWWQCYPGLEVAS